MPHIHTEPGQHDYTASAYIFRTDFDEPKVVFHKHKLTGRYLQFGGHVELNETPWQAVTHEVAEESGYKLDQLTLLQPKGSLRTLRDAVIHPVPICNNTHKFSETHFHTDVAYGFITNQAPAQPVAHHESGEIILLTRKEVLQLRDDQTFETVIDTVLYGFDVCLRDWESVDVTTFA